MAQSQYATTAQIQQLALTPAAYARFEALSTGSVTAQIQAASSVADSFLNSQFVLPLQVSPQGWDMVLTLHVCNIAAYFLYSQFGFSAAAPGMDQLIAQRYERALAWLDGISKKTISPVYVDSSGAAPGADSAGDFIVNDTPVGFTDRGVSTSLIFNPADFWC